MEYGNAPTHEDEGRVQVLVVLFSIISVKLFGFSAIYGEEVGPVLSGSMNSLRAQWRLVGLDVND